jgi:hypothetical protein
MPGDRFSDEENRLTSDREATFTKRYFVGVVCVGVVVVLFVTGSWRLWPFSLAARPTSGRR